MSGDAVSEDGMSADGMNGSGMSSARRRFITRIAKLGAAVGFAPQLAGAATETKVVEPAADAGGVSVETLKAAAKLADLEFTDEQYGTSRRALRKILSVTNSCTSSPSPTISLRRFISVHWCRG